MSEPASGYPRGSEWAVWDLHIHTPCSIEQHYGGNEPAAWERYLKALEALPEDVKVLGITDYYFPDGYERVMEAREKHGRLPRIETVLPILEFRIDTFGSASESKISKVNLHIVFNIDAKHWREGIARVRGEFIERLDISKHHRNKCLSLKNFRECASDGKQRTGFAELYPETDDVLKRLEAWKDETLLLLGYKEWNDLEKGKQAKLEKQDLFDRVQGFLTASPADFLEQKTKTLAAFGGKALLHSLDIHDLATLEAYECRTWIKAEPTFEGLRQALALPDDRVSHDLRPRKLLSVAARPETVIESIEIQSLVDDGEWFDRVGRIPLNPGLVAVIGNKGMGKTALADALCAASNCADAQYSFLSKEKFWKHRASKKYTARVRFMDGTTSSSPFRGVRHDPVRPTRLIYLSQAFVETLCNDVEGAERLQAQIDRVIFSHIPVETKGSHATLSSLVHATAESFERREVELRGQIHDINAQIAAAEATLTGENRRRLEIAAADLKQKLQEHQQNKPKDDGVVPTDSFLHALLSRRGSREQTAIATQRNIEAALQRLGEQRQSLDRVRQSVEALETAWQAIDTQINDNAFLRENLTLATMVSLRIDFDPLSKLQQEVTDAIESKRDKAERLKELLVAIHRSVGRIRAKLQGQERVRADAIVAAQTWQKRYDSLVGTAETPGSLRHAEGQLESLDTRWPAYLKELEAKRRGLCAELWQRIVRREQALSALYRDAQRRAEELAVQFQIPRDEFIAFDSAIRLSSSFAADFIGRINKNRAGYFHGSDNAQRQVDLLIQTVLEEHEGSWLELPFLIEAALKSGGTSSEVAGKPSDWADQLSGGQKSVTEIYDFLFSLQYLQRNFGIVYGNKPIELLSPGDRGLVLLIFFLLVDTSLNPIVIDQPEENVDNETIYERLVQFIKAAKIGRQIIIVTHNPNLAVVCDAEQVICAMRDKKNRDLIGYRSGGLESELKDDALRVLEGTRPAFVTRKRKYGL